MQRTPRTLRRSRPARPEQTIRGSARFVTQVYTDDKRVRRVGSRDLEEVGAPNGFGLLQGAGPDGEVVVEPFCVAEGGVAAPAGGGDVVVYYDGEAGVG